MSRQQTLRGMALGLALLTAVPLLWPADTPWISDEPLLLQRALELAPSFELPSHGLFGSAGTAYGPVPIALYMLAVRATHDLVWLVWLRALLVTACTALALYWLARSCTRLHPWLGLSALLSPYLWIYARMLWDNSFLIPLSALALASYVSFCRRPVRWKFALVVVCATMMFLTHLMALPVLGAISLHALWRMRPWLRAQLVFAVGTLGLAAIASFPYLADLLTHAQIHQVRDDATWQGALFPLLGGRVASSLGFEYFLGANWTRAPGPLASAVIDACNITTWIAVPLVWLGIGAAVRALARRPTELAEGADSELVRVALIALVLHVLLAAGTQSFSHPHYYNAMWLVYFALMWWALSQLGWVGRGLAALLGLSQALVLGHIISSVHHTEGNQSSHFGPTLGTQLRLLDQLAHFDPSSTLRNRTDHYRSYPHAFSVLTLFHPPPERPHRPHAVLQIEYERADPQYGRLALRVLSVDAGDGNSDHSR